MHTSEGLELESGSGSGSCIGDLPNCRPATKGNLSGPANRVGRVRLWHPQDIARAQIPEAVREALVPPSGGLFDVCHLQNFWIRGGLWGWGLFLRGRGRAAHGEVLSCFKVA